jgi:hypothetical protein
MGLHGLLQGWTKKNHYLRECNSVVINEIIVRHYEKTAFTIQESFCVIDCSVNELITVFRIPNPTQSTVNYQQRNDIHRLRNIALG